MSITLDFHVEDHESIEVYGQVLSGQYPTYMVKFKVDGNRANIFFKSAYQLFDFCDNRNIPILDDPRPESTESAAYSVVHDMIDSEKKARRSKI